MHILPHSSKGKLTGLFALTLAGACYSLCKGAIALSLGQLLSGLTSSLSSGGSLSMIMHLRMVRIASALLCGSALSLSGSLLQQTLNNPMAGPSILGINASAALSVLLGMLLFPSLTELLPLFSSIGALVGSLMVFSLAAMYRFSRLTLILSGIALSTVLGAISDALLTIFPDLATVKIDFLVGSFAHITPTQLSMLSPIIVMTMFNACLMGRPLTMLSLGDECATSLGLRVNRVRLLLLSLSAVLSALAISLCGLVGFLGLLVPHIARRMIPPHEVLHLPFTALLGGCIALFADTTARLIFAPYELPVGIVLSALGGPSFLAVLIRHRRGDRYA
ncbi:iron ABC transporter permease [uncultured Sphaerochaeta sp.]|uniref:FecCD family ABC transporter permease n=1 Tax=uncultured Sphaerochaeta sp. TaxID=886478 RepID=UPI0029C9F3E6|nr:iron ABC transporter permease [uncultured Sphaerochaeta sp.]